MKAKFLTNALQGRGGSATTAPIAQPSRTPRPAPDPPEPARTEGRFSRKWPVDTKTRWPAIRSGKAPRTRRTLGGGRGQNRHRHRNSGDAAGNHESQSRALVHAQIDHAGHQRDGGKTVEISGDSDDDSGGDRPPVAAAELFDDHFGGNESDHQAFDGKCQRQPLAQEPAGFAKAFCKQAAPFGLAPEKPQHPVVVTLLFSDV